MRLFPAKSIPLIAVGAAAVIATAVMAGWVFGLERFLTVLPGMIRMKSNTAAAFLLAAEALYLAYKRKYRPLQAICASGVALVGALTLIEYIWGVNLRIDQLLFHDPVQVTFPGRMAQITAANFLATGLMLYPFRFRASSRISDALALMVSTVSTFAVVGYLYGVPLLYGAATYTAMAIHTGLLFFVLSLGFLYVPKRGLVRIFRADTSGGVVARRLVPIAILIPIIVGGIFIRFNFGQPRLAIAFIVVCNVMLIVAAIWVLARVLNKSEIERDLAREASDVDGLTGINNRRYFDRRLQAEIERCIRYSKPASLVIFDVDHFKSINDRFGHPAGDGVIKTIAEVCKKSLRASDVLCRYGGEEFAVIAAETAGEDAMVLARKLRILVSNLEFDDVPAQVTISMGVAQIDEYDASPETVIAAADQALYTAKKQGRNCERLHGVSAPPELLLQVEQERTLRN